MHKLTHFLSPKKRIIPTILGVIPTILGKTPITKKSRHSQNDMLL